MGPSIFCVIQRALIDKASSHWLEEVRIAKIRRACCRASALSADPFGVSDQLFILVQGHSSFHFHAQMFRMI